MAAGRVFSQACETVTTLSDTGRDLGGQGIVPCTYLTFWFCFTDRNSELANKIGLNAMGRRTTAECGVGNILAAMHQYGLVMLAFGVWADKAVGVETREISASNEGALNVLIQPAGGPGETWLEASKTMEIGHRPVTMRDCQQQEGYMLERWIRNEHGTERRARYRRSQFLRCECPVGAPKDIGDKLLQLEYDEPTTGIELLELAELCIGRRVGPTLGECDSGMAQARMTQKVQQFTWLTVAICLQDEETSRWQWVFRGIGKMQRLIFSEGVNKNRSVLTVSENRSIVTQIGERSTQEETDGETAQATLPRTTTTREPTTTTTRKPTTTTTQPMTTPTLPTTIPARTRVEGTGATSLSPTTAEGEYAEVREGNCSYYIMRRAEGLWTQEEALGECRRFGGTLAMVKSSGTQWAIKEWLRQHDDVLGGYLGEL